MRRTPSIVRPSRSRSGGSNVFSALTPGASVDSIAAPRSASSRRRAVISTSGSSGTDPCYVRLRQVAQIVYDVTGARVAFKKGGDAAIGLREQQLLALLRPQELRELASSGDAQGTG